MEFEFSACLFCIQPLIGLFSTPKRSVFLSGTRRMTIMTGEEATDEDVALIESPLSPSPRLVTILLATKVQRK